MVARTTRLRLHGRWWTSTYEDSIGHLEENLTGTAREVWQANADARAVSTPFGQAVLGATLDDPTAPFRPTLDQFYQAIEAAGNDLLQAIDRAVAAEQARLRSELLVMAAVVTAAFNEAVANLQTIDSMTAALARGDIDAAESTPVPGEIGRTLRGAMEKLAESIREGEQLQRRLRHQAHHDSLTGLTGRGRPHHDPQRGSRWPRSPT